MIRELILERLDPAAPRLRSEPTGHPPTPAPTIAACYGRNARRGGGDWKRPGQVSARTNELPMGGPRFRRGAHVKAYWPGLGVLLLLVLLAVGDAAFYYSRLPAVIASHFDAQGKPDGWIPKAAAFRTQAILLGGTTSVLLILCLAMQFMPASMVNVPNKDYWFAPERLRQSRQRLTVWMLWFTSALVAFLIGLFDVMFRANLRPGPDRARYFGCGTRGSRCSLRFGPRSSTGISAGRARRKPAPRDSAAMEYRRLGNTGLELSAVALGCWPIAGMTSPGTNDETSLATVRACFDLGINHLDTAYMYGRAGESERLIARSTAGRRDELVIATKVGLAWDERGRQVLDGRPETLRRQCEESLKRLATDRIEILYLHKPDPHVPLSDSAGAPGATDRARQSLCGRRVERESCRARGVRGGLPACRLPAAVQHARAAIEADTLPWCQRQGVAVVVYWPLMKGLSGRLHRTRCRLRRSDSRRNYPAFQGEEFQRNCDLVDELGEVARAAGRSVAQVVVNWTVYRPGITAVLCGAKRPEQIRETAGGVGWRLDETQLAGIEAALIRHGQARLAPGD